MGSPINVKSWRERRAIARPGFVTPDLPGPMRNDRLDRLAEFPFRRLAALLAHEPPPAGPTLDLALGEPKHQPPALLAETVAAHAQLWNRYPPVNGTPEFRAAVAAWLTRRFELPAGGARPGPPRRCRWPAPRRASISCPRSWCRRTGAGPPPAVLMPDPVYAVYYGAAVMAGAEPVLLPATAATGFLPDLDALTPDLLARTALLLPVLAGQPARRGGRPRLSAPGRAARARARLPARGRRMLQRALGRGPAAGRADRSFGRGRRASPASWCSIP